MLWRCVIVVCQGRQFFTTLPTLQSVEGSHIKAMFSDPYSLYQAEMDAHVIPPTLCRSAAAFAVVLDYLRMPHEWPVLTDVKLWEEVCYCCEKMTLPNKPLRPYRCGGDSAQPKAAALECRYEVENVFVPFVSSWKDKLSGKPEVAPSKGAKSACHVVAPFGQRGYCVIGEVSVECSTVGREALLRDEQQLLLEMMDGDRESCAQLTMEDREKLRSALFRKSSVLVMERRVPAGLMYIDALATLSSWFAALSECA